LVSLPVTNAQPVDEAAVEHDGHVVEEERLEPLAGGRRLRVLAPGGNGERLEAGELLSDGRLGAIPAVGSAAWPT
jgi:hypothetical protein